MNKVATVKYAYCVTTVQKDLGKMSAYLQSNSPQSTYEDHRKLRHIGSHKS